MLLELSTLLILQAFVIFCGPVKEMVALSDLIDEMAEAKHCNPKILDLGFSI